MKHLKYFENNSIDDIIEQITVNTYWKYSKEIIKVVSRHNDNMRILRKNNFGNFHKSNLSISMLKNMLPNNHLIFTPATEEQITSFNKEYDIYTISKETDKYNL